MVGQSITKIKPTSAKITVTSLPQQELKKIVNHCRTDENNIKSYKISQKYNCTVDSHDFP